MYEELKNTYKCDKQRAKYTTYKCIKCIYTIFFSTNFINLDVWQQGPEVYYTEPSLQFSLMRW